MHVCMYVYADYKELIHVILHAEWSVSWDPGRANNKFQCVGVSLESVPMEAGMMRDLPPYSVNMF